MTNSGLVHKEEHIHTQSKNNRFRNSYKKKKNRRKWSSWSSSYYSERLGDLPSFQEMEKRFNSNVKNI